MSSAREEVMAAILTQEGQEEELLAEGLVDKLDRE